MSQCQAKTRRGAQCRQRAVRGKRVCYYHGGAPGSGRPTEHALYSESIPQEWREQYERLKSDPDYLSLREEIALARTNLERFLAKCEGTPFTTEMRSHVIDHLDHIGRLNEREAKRLYRESVVKELLGKQVDAEAAILRRVLSEHLDSDTADRVASQFADLVTEEAGVGTGVSM